MPRNTTTSASVEPFIGFPNEILLQIVQNVSTHDHATLSSLCKVNKELYAMASPLLWKHLKITPWTVKHSQHHFISTRKISSFKRNVGNMNSKTPKIKSMLKEIEYLEIQDHKSTWCNSRKPTGLNLPNLDILKMRLIKKCHLHVDYDLSFANIFHNINKPCRLLMDIQPRILILDNYTFENSLGFLYSKSIPSSIIKTVEILVFIISSSDNSTLKAHASIYSSDSLGRIPNLKKIYFIFNPLPPVIDEKKSSSEENEYSWNIRHTDRVGNGDYLSFMKIIFNCSEDVLCTWVNSGSTFLSLPEKQQMSFYKIINDSLRRRENSSISQSSDVDPTNIIKHKLRNKFNRSDMFGPYAVQFQNIVTSELHKAMQAHFWTEARKIKKKANINFLTLDEWMKDENAAIWLGKDELMKWKNCMDK